MGTIIRQLASYENDLCVVTMEYSDVSMLITKISVVNNGTEPVSISITRTSDGRVTSQTFSSGTNSVNIPTTVSKRVLITDLGHGKLGNVIFNFAYPAAS
jgi:hypothetical protein